MWNVTICQPKVLMDVDLSLWGTKAFGIVKSRVEAQNYRAARLTLCPFLFKTAGQRNLSDRMTNVSLSPLSDMSDILQALVEWACPHFSNSESESLN